MIRAWVPEIGSAVKTRGTTNVVDGADMERVRTLQLFDPRMTDKGQYPNGVGSLHSKCRTLQISVWSQVPIVIGHISN